MTGQRRVSGSHHQRWATFDSLASAASSMCLPSDHPAANSGTPAALLARLCARSLSPCAQGKVALKARKRDAVMFVDMKPNGNLHRGSRHGGCPVIKGEKVRIRLSPDGQRLNADSTGTQARHTLPMVRRLLSLRCCALSSAAALVTACSGSLRNGSTRLGTLTRKKSTSHTRGCSGMACTRTVRTSTINARTGWRGGSARR